MVLRIAFTMARANLWKLLRDRKALLMLIAMPLLLTAILSNALSSVFGSAASIPKFTIAVVNQDTGQYGQSLVNFLDSQTKQLTVRKVTNITDARKLVKSGEASLDLSIPKNYSTTITSGKSVKMQIEAPLNKDTDKAVINGMISAYGQQMASMTYLKQQSAKAGKALEPQQLQIQTQDSGLHPIGSGAYYAIGMMVMFLLTNAFNRGSSMVEEKESDLYKRMIASPASRYALAAGHWVSNFVVLLVQGTVLLVGARYLLNIHFGPPAQMAILLVSYAFSLSGVTIAVGSLINNQQVTSGLGNIGSQIAAVLGGSIFPIYGFPKFMQTIAHILPNGTAVAAMVNSVLGISTRGLLLPVLYMLAVGLVMGLAASIRYGRRLA
ncbi:ABC transporter permease [Alicyclobacillus sp. SO9]|uniref:ABC transporter permease n=1 Tax=Alicyclobacillus sp. SO9 TaxID=2665646 RepID=UPI0018E7DF5F|nr:ABC transporter permease [Alicyclobacillus sp. SO9]QQE78583.1 ABC transporter permease [Alicyclobacillus sp. SO9]